MGKSFILVLLCLSGLSLLAYHAQSNGHSVAIIPSVSSESNTPEQVCSADGSCSATTTTKTTAIFEPTHKWKEILPHEEVPGGLHIRINLQTGKKEAKLLDETEEHIDTKKTNIYEDTSISESVVRDEKGEVIGESLYQALAQLPEPPSLDGMNIHEAYGKLTKEQFSAYIAKLWKARQEELKEAATAIRDEAKYMQQLINTLIIPKTGNADEYEANVIDALQNLEWEVQDLDKAKDFNTLGGLEATVLHLNASSYRVRTMAAWVVGSAVKHYNDAQTWALEAGAMPMVLQSLAVVPLEADRSIVSAMQKKMLYALSSLLEANEKAQDLFFRNGGVLVLEHLLSSDVTIPIRHKVIALAHHLIAEGQHLESRTTHPLFSIQSSLTSESFCALSLSFLESTNLNPRQQVDAIDLISYQIVPCKHIFQPTINSIITKLNQTWYDDRELENEFKAENMRKLERLQQTLRSTHE